MEVEPEEAEETHATAPPIPPNPNLNLDALDALCKNWAIEVTYLASWQKKYSKFFSLLLEFDGRNTYFLFKSW